MRIVSLLSRQVLSPLVGLAIGCSAAAAAGPGWEQLVAAAKKEGKVEVVLSGQMPVKLRGVLPEFEKQYGVKVNFQTGQGRAHAARILAERRAGRYTVDVWIGGANTALSRLYPNKALAPLDALLIDPSVKDPKNWFKGKLHFSDPENKFILAWGASPAYVVVVNPKLVDPSSIKSYWDLLDPKFKGKIVGRSFARTGSGATAVPMFLNKDIGAKWFEKLVTEMDYTVVRDSRQGAEWVALGRFAIGLFGLNTPGRELEMQGLSIKSYLPQVLKEGEILTSSAANIMALDKPANPNAQKLFVNWFLSRDAQLKMIKSAQTSDSLRVDVPEDAVPDQYRIKRNRDYYIAFSDPIYISEQRKHLKTLRKIMKKLKK
jgi:ABC-type Fe3+ transport system substrate-binding protein